MDPLSVSMAVIGLLAAAKQISSALSTLISNSKNAPKEMQSVKSTVETIRTVLLQLQTILLGRENISRKRTSLILVEQVVITLSACVTTFSELDVFVGALQSDETLGLMDRIRWGTKTTTIKEHLQKLEMHKSSLTLMMTILTCESIYKAEDAVDELSDMIQRVLDGHQVLARRLLSIELCLNTNEPLTSQASQLPQPGETAPELARRNAEGFAFEEDLQNSWVYKRSDRRNDGGAFSVVSSAGRTASWSMLSGLSLSDSISVIAVQALPVYSHDLSNSEVYKFGEFNDSEETIVQEDFGLSEERDRSLRARLSRVAAGISLRIPGRRPSGSGIPNTVEPGIFGAPLHESISRANVAISSVDPDGSSYIYGYIPLVVAKIGVYLKEHATLAENIFSKSGSAKHIHDLEVIFESSEARYGKKLDWKSYDVYDAASCLLRYLKLLPDPVIPVGFYDQFTAAINPDDFKGSIKSLQESILSIPSLNRQLLLYILDLIAVFARNDEANHMNSERLASAFHPSLLSRIPRNMSAEDHSRAVDTIVFMVENPDYFVLGMTRLNMQQPMDEATLEVSTTTAEEVSRSKSM